MVGGLGSLAGSIIGSIVITVAPQVFISFPGFQELVFGLLIILVILFLPRGLASLLARRTRRSTTVIIGGDIPLLELCEVTVRLRRTGRSRRRVVQRQLGRDLRAHRPERRRQDTLFNAISGNALVDSGNILFRGDEISGLTPHTISSRGVRRTFQNGGLFAHLTALENVLVGLHVQVRSRFLGLLVGAANRCGETTATGRARELLALMGVGGIADRRLAALSRRPTAHRRNRAGARDRSAAAAAG